MVKSRVLWIVESVGHSALQCSLVGFADGATAEQQQAERGM